MTSLDVNGNKIKVGTNVERVIGGFFNMTVGTKSTVISTFGGLKFKGFRGTHDPSKFKIIEGDIQRTIE